MTEPVTYGDISSKLAENAVQKMLNDRNRDLLRYMLMWIEPPPLTPWQKVRRFIRRARSFARARWWLAEKLRDLSYWIEP